jgi:hypothetical protein
MNQSFIITLPKGATYTVGKAIEVDMVRDLQRYAGSVFLDDAPAKPKRKKDHLYLIIEDFHDLSGFMDYVLDLKDKLGVTAQHVTIGPAGEAGRSLDKLSRATLANVMEYEITRGGAGLESFDVTKGIESPVSEPVEQPRTSGASAPVSDSGPAPRFLQGRMPERVCLGAGVDLQVRVALAPAAVSARLRPLALPAEGGKLTLVLYAPGFRVPAANSQMLPVPAAADSDWALFELEAEKEGVHTLEVSAYYQGAFLGSLALQVTVEARTATGPGATRSGPLGFRMPERGEVTLEIRYDAGAQVYRFRLIDHSIGGPDEGLSDRLRRTPESAVEDLVARLNEQARNVTGFSAAQTRLWLQGKGIELWNEFVPRALQEQFWERRDRITRMNIVAANDPVPWELLYPFRPGGSDAGFLAEQFPVSRWRFGPSPPTHLRLGHRVFVRPDGSPPQANAELIVLQVALGTGDTVSQLDPLLAKLQQGDFDLLHFACHNSFIRESPGESFIRMDGGRHFMPAFLAVHEGRFRHRAPLVFMNACRTDGVAGNYTRLVGWADRFLSAGAGAFVGTLWEVRDGASAEFARAFYSRLRGGGTLGDAVRDARGAIRDRPGDPTWLAYTLYGDPAATLTQEA